MNGLQPTESFNTGLKVLLVDDSDLVRERLLVLLGEIPGVGLLAQARDYDQASRLIPQVIPDVIILDIHLPGKNGLVLLKKIKQSAFSPTVIILTSCSASQYRAHCLHAGADYFFEKSNQVEHVAETIRLMTAT
jgi:DNA-binding NarL/FixJ family response regulator